MVVVLVLLVVVVVMVGMDGGSRREAGGHFCVSYCDGRPGAGVIYFM